MQKFSKLTENHKLTWINFLKKILRVKRVKVLCKNI